MKKGTFFVLSGPSGSGKGTVIKEVLKNCDNLQYSVSATSRLPRVGEKEGVNYFFKTRSEFEKMIDDGDFLEYTETYGNYYGTPKARILEAVEDGESIILEIDPVGARNIRFSYPEAVLIFLIAPSLEELKARLTKRGTEDELSFSLRHNAAISEIENASLYDYVVVNADVAKAADDIIAIVRAENLKTQKNTEILSQIKGGIKL